MQINYFNNQYFGARIKISKMAKTDLKDASALSAIGTSASATGLASSMPAFDPAHHVHSAARVVDGAFALTGSGFSILGARCMNWARSLFKDVVRSSKIPS